MQKLSLFLSYLINILFPKTCSGCDNIGSFLCEKCIATSPRSTQTESRFITAIFDYQSKAIRNAIWRFKYKNTREIAECFGVFIYDEIIGDLGDNIHISKTEPLLLVPLPLHKKRMRERGYNQSELLAREIIKHDIEKIFELSLNVLVRTRETKAQAKKEKRTARFENLRGAFETPSAYVKRKHIILIDDVTTTGATLLEARKVLIKAGAKSVQAYTVAH